MYCEHEQDHKDYIKRIIPIVIRGVIGGKDIVYSFQMNTLFYNEYIVRLIYTWQSPSLQEANAIKCVLAHKCPELYGKENNFGETRQTGSPFTTHPETDQ